MDLIFNVIKIIKIENSDIFLVLIIGGFLDRSRRVVFLFFIVLVVVGDLVIEFVLRFVVFGLIFFVK